MYAILHCAFSERQHCADLIQGQELFLFHQADKGVGFGSYVVSFNAVNHQEEQGLDLRLHPSISLGTCAR